MSKIATLWLKLSIPLIVELLTACSSQPPREEPTTDFRHFGVNTESVQAQFPNRARGVALYQQGQYAQALSWLERSLAEHPSQLAMDYRIRVELAMAAPQADKQPPTVRIDRVQRAGQRHWVQGQARDDRTGDSGVEWLQLGARRYPARQTHEHEGVRFALQQPRQHWSFNLVWTPSAAAPQLPSQLRAQDLAGHRTAFIPLPAPVPWKTPAVAKPPPFIALYPAQCNGLDTARCERLTAALHAAAAHVLQAHPQMQAWRLVDPRNIQTVATEQRLCKLEFSRDCAQLLGQLLPRPGAFKDAFAGYALLVQAQQHTVGTGEYLELAGRVFQAQSGKALAESDAYCRLTETGRACQHSDAHHATAPRELAERFAEGLPAMLAPLR